MWVALLLDHPAENGGYVFLIWLHIDDIISQKLDAIQANTIFHKICKTTGGPHYCMSTDEDDLIVFSTHFGHIMGFSKSFLHNWTLILCSSSILITNTLVSAVHLILDFNRMVLVVYYIKNAYCWRYLPLLVLQFFSSMYIWSGFPIQADFSMLFCLSRWILECYFKTGHFLLHYWLYTFHNNVYN